MFAPFVNGLEFRAGHLACGSEACFAQDVVERKIGLAAENHIEQPCANRKGQKGVTYVIFLNYPECCN
jgi:hypothetical protein